MTWPLWLGVGVVAWCVVSVIVSLVLGPALRRRSQRLAQRPGPTTPETTRPDSSGPTRRQNGAVL